MKVYLLLLLLLPLCSADFTIQCYGEDFLMVNNMLLDCSGPVQQACYTRDSLACVDALSMSLLFNVADNGEKGCTPKDNCSKPGWTCCHTNRCNA
ncbi:uncharacterized protein LOC142943712 [Anarhichas minor]|uniref:uncharacterized protein LOC142943712 n=1 Tax=Anarhichas minor TaxID=65739 RepID=UPI003F73F591